MSNHVHLIAIPAAGNSLARSLGRAHVDYARWLNLRRGESGHVWQNRFFSRPMDERHQWEALRYVESNPVRAGVVSEASDWPGRARRRTREVWIAGAIWIWQNGAGVGRAEHGAKPLPTESRMQCCWNAFAKRYGPGVRLRAKSL